MDDATLVDLQKRLLALESTSVRYRAGEVTGTGPLDIALGGSSTSYENVRQVLPGAHTGDHVGALVYGNDLLVLGHVVPSGTTAYTPSWTSSGTAPAIVNGTLTGLYQVVGDLVYVAINLVAGSSTTYGTGFYNFSLPVAPRAGFRMVLNGVLTDVGTQSYDVNAVINGSSSFEEILAASNAAGPTNWGATNPFTLGSSDRITISGVYAAA